MTDRVDTNQDLEMTLTAIGEQLTTAVDPAALIEGVGAQLGVLYNNAEAAKDEAAKLAIQKAWDDAQLLVNEARHSRQVAATALDIAGTLQTQRDDVMKELEDLTKAVEDMDTDNPLVETLYDAVYESGSEQGYQDGYESASNDLAEEVDEYVYDQAYEIVDDKYGEAFGYDEEANRRKSTFSDILWVNIELSDERKAEFFAWLDAVKADNEGDDDDE